MIPEPLRTARLELAPLTTRLVQAMVEGDGIAAGREVGAKVGRWHTADPSHLVQLHLAGQTAEARGFPGLGRVVIRNMAVRPRCVIGSIGFHGAPDERGRLEASCRIHPAHRGFGYASEALGALLDWATARYGVSRFLVAVPAREERIRPVPVEIALGPNEPLGRQVEQIAGLLEPERHGG